MVTRDLSFGIDRAWLDSSRFGVCACAKLWLSQGWGVPKERRLS